ncbi:hypothetical protein AB6D11_00015 [Vibrio splendidus]
MNQFSTVEDIKKKVKGFPVLIEDKLEIIVNKSSFNPYLMRICLLTGVGRTFYFNNQNSTKPWCTADAQVDSLGEIKHGIETGAPYIEFKYFEADKWWDVYLELDDYDLSPSRANNAFFNMSC